MTHILTNILIFFVLLYLCLRLVVAAPAGAVYWLNGLIGWLRSEGWHPCSHAQTMRLTDRAPPGMVTVTTRCVACQRTLLAISDTEANWEYAQQRTERSEPMRRVLTRWVVPPCREYRRFCTYIGCMVVSTALVLWLSWDWTGAYITQAMFGSPACRMTFVAAFTDASEAPACHGQGDQP